MCPPNFLANRNIGLIVHPRKRLQEDTVANPKIPFLLGDYHKASKYTDRVAILSPSAVT